MGVNADFLRIPPGIGDVGVAWTDDPSSMLTEIFLVSSLTETVDDVSDGGPDKQQAAKNMTAPLRTNASAV